MSILEIFDTDIVLISTLIFLCTTPLMYRTFWGVFLIIFVGKGGIII